MKLNNSEPIKRKMLIRFSDVTQDYWPTISNVQRLIELWPYVFIFISLAGFVYLFNGVR
jgi:hypothetical protein